MPAQRVHHLVQKLFLRETAADDASAAASKKKGGPMSALDPKATG